MHHHPTTRTAADSLASVIPPIESDRLQLISLSVEVLRLLVERRFAAAQEMCDFVLSGEASLRESIWLTRRLRMMEEDPAQHPWMYRAIVRRSDRRMVGYISFHHKAPDPDLLEYADNAAELGYAVDPEFRRKGYATESALAMMRWAYQKHGTESFVLSISPRNLPSLKMAEAMGFKKIGERQDDIDGLEFTMRAEGATFCSQAKSIKSHPMAPANGATGTSAADACGGMPGASPTRAPSSASGFWSTSVRIRKER